MKTKTKRRLNWEAFELTEWVHYGCAVACTVVAGVITYHAVVGNIAWWLIFSVWMLLFAADNGFKNLPSVKTIVVTNVVDLSDPKQTEQLREFIREQTKAHQAGPTEDDAGLGSDRRPVDREVRSVDEAEPREGEAADAGASDDDDREVEPDEQSRAAGDTDRDGDAT